MFTTFKFKTKCVSLPTKVLLHKLYICQDMLVHLKRISMT